MIRDRDTRVSRGFGFVSFEARRGGARRRRHLNPCPPQTDRLADAALRLNGAKLGDRIVRVNASRRGETARVLGRAVFRLPPPPG